MSSSAVSHPTPDALWWADFHPTPLDLSGLDFLNEPVIPSDEDVASTASSSPSDDSSSNTDNSSNRDLEYLAKRFKLNDVESQYCEESLDELGLDTFEGYFQLPPAQSSVATTKPTSRSAAIHSRPKRKRDDEQAEEAEAEPPQLGFDNVRIKVCRGHCNRKLNLFRPCLRQAHGDYFSQLFYIPPPLPPPSILSQVAQVATDGAVSSTTATIAVPSPALFD